MFDERVDGLDAGATLGFVSEMRSVAERAEARLLEGVAHWADLHGHVDGVPTRPGRCPAPSDSSSSEATAPRRWPSSPRPS